MFCFCVWPVISLICILKCISEVENEQDHISHRFGNINVFGFYLTFTFFQEQSFAERVRMSFFDRIQIWIHDPDHTDFVAYKETMIWKRIILPWQPCSALWLTNGVPRWRTQRIPTSRSGTERRARNMRSITESKLLHEWACSTSGWN